MKFRTVIFFITSFCLFILIACGPKTISPNSWLDSPARHVHNGNQLLESGKLDAAFREYNRAVELDSNYPPAYIGLSMIYGIKGDDEMSSMNMKKAINIMKETLNP